MPNVTIPQLSGPEPYEVGRSTTGPLLLGKKTRPRTSSMLEFQTTLLQMPLHNDTALLCHIRFAEGCFSTCEEELLGCPND
jgi:hypothetical protein